MLEHTKNNATLQEHPAPEDNVPEARDTSNAKISPQDKTMTILWDFNIDRFMKHRRPDNVLVDGAAKKALVIDIAVSGDPLVAEKEVEKRAKYQLLARKILPLWQVETQFVPVIVGTLGTFPNSFFIFICKEHKPGLRQKIRTRKITKLHAGGTKKGLEHRSCGLPEQTTNESGMTTSIH